MIDLRSTTDEVPRSSETDLSSFHITESLSLEDLQQQHLPNEQEQQSQQQQEYTGMARFGTSFADMAEAMLGDEYATSHHPLLHPDLKTSTSSQIVNSFLVERPGDGATGSGLPPPALKRKPRSAGEGYENSGNNGSSTSVNSEGGLSPPSPEKRNPDSRSVVIQDPPKRQRIEGTARSASDVTQALNRAVSQEERLDAIQDAIWTFDHDNRDQHDSEIAAGADIALVKALVFLEFKAGFRREPIQADMEAISSEIGLVLKALECVYRANTESVGESFDRVGTDLLHVLVILIDDEVKNRIRALSPESSPEPKVRIDGERGDGIHSAGDDDHDSKRSGVPHLHEQTTLYRNAGVGNLTRDILLRKTTKILGHFARVGKATRPMAHFPGFLGSILNLINMRPYTSIPFEARLSCLWTIANLACNTDNMTMMVCTPDLVNSLISIGCRQNDPDDSLETIMETLRAKSIASRALLNLSWSPENKIIMSENYALVQVLAQLSMERKSPYRNSKTIQDIMVSTRRHAIGALRNMAAAPRRLKIALCKYNNGKLLDALTDVALSETDSSAIDLVFSAIHNLAIHDTAEAMVDRPALVLALKNVLLEDVDGEDISSSSTLKNSRKHDASSTILVLERSITPEMPCYENLRELLDAGNPSTSSDGESDSNDIVGEAVSV